MKSLYNFLHTLQAKAVICLVRLGSGQKRAVFRYLSRYGGGSFFRLGCGCPIFQDRGRIADFQTEQSFSRLTFQENFPIYFVQLHARFHGIVQRVGIQSADVRPVVGQGRRNIYFCIQTDTAPFHNAFFDGQHGVDSGVSAAGKGLGESGIAGQLFGVGRPLLFRQGG